MKRRYSIDILSGDSHLTDGKLYRLQESHIIIKEQGKYLGHSNDWDLTRKDIETLNFYTPIKDIDLTDKNIYRHKNLTLPRQKVDLLKEKFNIKVIRDSAKADYHIISKKLLAKIITRDWKDHYNFSDIFNFFKNLKEMDVLSSSGLEKARDFVNHGDREGVYCLNQVYTYGNDPKAQKVREKIQSTYDKLKESIFANQGSRAMILLENTDFMIYQDILKNKHKLIYDVDVLDIIDEDLAVISNSEYDRIKQMICSNDRENRTLAVEMLANCNINKSFDVVSGIYYWCYDWIKDTSNWNSINVKSLREQMKSYQGSHNGNNSNSAVYNRYLTLLADDGKLTKFAVDMTRDNLSKEVLKHFVNNDNAFTISTDQIILNKKLTDKIINE